MAALLLFWRDIKELQASPEGGEVATDPDELSVVISLAPYCLPILTIPLVTIRFFISPSVTATIIDFLIGFTFGFHVFALLKEFGFKQPDIKEVGRLFSLGVICFMNSILVVIIVCVVSGNLSSIRNYGVDSWVRVQEFYRFSGEALRILEEALRALLKTLLAIVCENC